jgi:hypothetical protein
VLQTPVLTQTPYPPPQAKPRTSTVRGPPPPGHTFGQKRIRDSENAKDVTMRWHEHNPTPDSLPGLDFKTMNKLAAVNSVVSCAETSAFRGENRVTLRAGAGDASAPGGSNLFLKPALPSDTNPEHRYGKSSKVPSREDKKFGSQDNVKSIVNGEFANAWCLANEKRRTRLNAAAKTQAPTRNTTRAMEFVARAATEKIAPAPKPQPFKMKKFAGVASRFRG